MDTAHKLKEEIFSWVDRLVISKGNVNGLVSVLEEHKKTVDAGGQGKSSGVRLAEIQKSKRVKQLEDMKEREKRIQALLETLAEEGKKREQPEGYVVEQVLRAMAKMELNDQINIHNLLCEFSGKKFFMLKTFVNHHQKLDPGQNDPVGADKGSEVGGQEAALLFSVSGLTDELKNLDRDHCQTEIIQCLRESAAAMMTTYHKMKEEEREIKEVFKEWAVVRRCIKKDKTFTVDMPKLISLVKHMCDDETLQWLTNISNSDSKSFFKLVDLFHLVKEKIYEETKKDHDDIIHITFVAHGAITDPMIPASRFLPLPTIHDVVLHSPWNCLLCPNAAYGVATGLLKPENTVFRCINRKCCLPNKNHQPKTLNQWNSMRKEKERKKEKEESIPNIIVSPIKMKTDGAWKGVEFLKETYGEPGTNRIVIVYTVHGKIKPSDKVPFYAVTLALSLVLFFSRFKATVHLAACLGDRSGEKLDETALDLQYAWTYVNTGMTCKIEKTAKDSNLYEVMNAVFGPPLLRDE